MSPPFQSESDLIKFLDSVDDEIKNSRGDLDRRVSENLDLYRGKQWKGKAAPSFMFNVIEASIEDKNGKLSETKPEIMVLPSSNGLGPVADLLTQVVTSIWDKNKVEYKTERLALMGAICGAAFVGTPFNRRLANGVGDIDAPVEHLELRFQQLVAGAADQAQRCLRGQVADLGADGDLVARNDTPVAGDERDHAREVDVADRHVEVNDAVGRRVRIVRVPCRFRINIRQLERERRLELGLRAGVAGRGEEDEGENSQHRRYLDE